MPKISAKKPGFLEKLGQLRSFVGETVEENDLENCLKQCGCDVDLAAMKLMTGDYTKSAKKRSSGFFFQAQEKTKKPRVSLSPNFDEQITQQTPKLASKKKRAVASRSSSTNEPLIIDDDDDDVEKNTNQQQQQQPYLLCQRWLMADCNTSRGSMVRYQESLAVTCSQSGPPMVRLRGRNAEGTLTRNLAIFMAPLLRQGLLELKVEALMEEKRLHIGAQFPVNLRLSILNPRAFFALFDSSLTKDTGSARNTYFGNLAKNNKRNNRTVDKMDLAQCAFDLLQWAHYGDVPDYKPAAAAAAAKKEEEASSESADDAVLDESAFEEEEQQQQGEAWAKRVVDEAASKDDPLQNIKEMPEPPGFKNVTLRPYQKQALRWMWNREHPDSSNREVVEQELSLLSELAASRNKAKSSSPYVDPYLETDDVKCDCGPVLLSKAAAAKSTTLDGAVNPVTHPLWQRRFLAVNDNTTISFYVNELLGVASAEPPNPPRQCVGGIQADAMGLGKTVMLLALLLKSKHEEAAGNTTLVVAPLSLIAQWEEELGSKTDLSHKVYYGDNSSKRRASVSGFDHVNVVVTTYGTLQGELYAMTKKNSRKGDGLLSHDWFRVILDEAHCIKNAATLCSRACCMLKAERRWCVTGTPIQNSLQDAYGLLKFLHHEPWCESGFWKKAITSSLAQNKEEEDETNDGMGVALDRVRRVLSPLLLRRSKDTRNAKGEPILTLPPLEIKIVDVSLSTPEREFYTALKSKSQSIFEGIIGSGKFTKSYFQIFALLNRLRQSCDHVALTVKSHMDESDWNPTEIDTTKAANKSPSKPPVDDGLNEKFMMDLLSKFEVKQSSSDKENVNEFTSQVATKLSQAVSSSSETVEDECAICLETPKITQAVVTPCAHVFCSDCLVKVLRASASSSNTVGVPDGECPCCKKKVEARRIIALYQKDDGKTDTKFLLDDDDVKVKTELAAADVAARATLESALKGASSAKLNAIMDELDNVWNVDPGAKVLIFSQFLGFLDLLQLSMRHRKIPYGRLDGKLSLSERKKVVEKFKNEKNNSGSVGHHNRGSVLLMSMKAGGVGLNLVQASAVFIVDPWWNAAIEDQCIMRCHRIGQTAQVVRVRKFVVQHSVEERIVSLQERKKNMAGQILDGGTDMENANKATLDDFKLLFSL